MILEIADIRIHPGKNADFEAAIARGAGSGPLIVGGDAISGFLRSRKDGLASFIIVRETGESDPSGLVHGFASKEYPGGTPPTLRIR